MWALEFPLTLLRENQWAQGNEKRKVKAGVWSKGHCKPETPVQRGRDPDFHVESLVPSSYGPGVEMEEQTFVQRPPDCPLAQPTPPLPCSSGLPARSSLAPAGQGALGLSLLEASKAAPGGKGPPAPEEDPAEAAAPQRASPLLGPAQAPAEEKGLPGPFTLLPDAHVGAPDHTPISGARVIFIENLVGLCRASCGQDPPGQVHQELWEEMARVTSCTWPRALGRPAHLAARCSLYREARLLGGGGEGHGGA